MYATAHWVKQGDEEGINAFLHSHAGEEWPADVSRLTRWPEENPGRLVARKTQLPPGGNLVRAYLDVIAPDGTPHDEIAAVLALLAEDIYERRNPTVFHQGAVVVRFGVEVGLEPMRRVQYDALRKELLSLLRSPSTRP